MCIKCGNILPQKSCSWTPRFGFNPMHFYPSICTGSARAAHVWPDSGLLRRGALLCRHGMYLHRRGRQNQGQAALQRSRVPPLRRPVGRQKKKTHIMKGEPAKALCPHAPLVFNNTCVYRCGWYCWLLLIHQQDRQDILCCQSGTWSLEVQLNNLTFLLARSISDVFCKLENSQ